MFLYLSSGEGYFDIDNISPSEQSKIIGARNVIETAQEYIYTHLPNIKYLDFCANVNISAKIANLQGIIKCSVMSLAMTYANNTIIINYENKIPVITRNVSIIFNLMDTIMPIHYLHSGVIKVSLSGMSQELLDTMQITFPISINILIINAQSVNCTKFMLNNRIPYGCQIILTTQSGLVAMY
jgi:Na+-transporting NADH:ubiquinone oxidoreductase subunit NqrE